MKIEVGKFYKCVSEGNEDFKKDDIVIVREIRSDSFDEYVEVALFGGKISHRSMLAETFEEDFIKIEMATVGESVNAVFDSLRRLMYGKEDEQASEPCEYPEGTELTPNGLFTIDEPSKPAHYDTAIDTIAFAKANFSREQVEGFMRINAVKYIQRYDKKNGAEDIRKAIVYLNMLLEHVEGEEE